MPPRILLANEFGAGRGHLTTLCRVGKAFGSGYCFDAALGARTHDDVLAPLNADIFDGPKLVYHRARRRGPDAVTTATWGEFLGDLGFDRIARLREVLAWWRLVLTSRKVALVVGDYAPLALLAARSLGIPSIATGTGYGLPPTHLPVFPLLNPANQTRLHVEAQLLANVNTVIAEFGMAPLAGLPEVYAASQTILRTIPLLDFYRADRDRPYFPPIARPAQIPDQRGDEVFIYFSTIEFQEPALIEALCRLRLPRRAYLPAVPPDVADRLAASGMILEPAPVSMDQIAARSRVVLNAGQHGTLCLGLYAGLPQVCLPQHMEQMYHAEQIAQSGAGVVLGRHNRSADDICTTITDAYTNTFMQDAARCLATELRAKLALSPDAQLAQAVAPIRVLLDTP